MNYHKIYGGTPKGNGSMCDSCSYAQVVKGYAESEKITICTYTCEPFPILFQVSECTSYVNRNLPAVEEMKQIAWMLRSKKAGREAGFLTAEQNRQLNENKE